MIYLLDTSTCVTLLRGQSAKAADRLTALRPKDVVVCSLVKAELYFGACRSREPERNLTAVNELLHP
jgi:tRNA(fMet)-specific endonuclease VapC